MYIPKHFAESDTDVLYDFIRHNPFATLVTHVDGNLVLPTKSRHPNYAAKAAFRSNSTGAT